MGERPENPWHDYTIWQIAQLLESYRTLIDVETNPGKKHGSDIVAKRSDNGRGILKFKCFQVGKILYGLLRSGGGVITRQKQHVLFAQLL